MTRALIRRVPAPPADQPVGSDQAVQSESAVVFDRDSLTPEVDWPTTANTGVYPNVARTAYAGPYTITADNTVIENKDLNDFLKIQAANVIVRNCKNIGPVAAPTSGKALIDCSSSACVNALIEDVHLEPQTLSRFTNGVQGGNFTAKRLYIRNTVDYFSCYAGNGTTDPLNILIEIVLGDGMHAESPDSSHTDNITHNDGIQIQGGTGPFKAWGNDLYAGYKHNGSFTTGSGGLAATDRGTGDDTNGRYQDDLGFCCIQFTNIGSWFPHSVPGGLIQIHGNICRGGNRAINAGSANNTDIGEWYRNWVDDDQGIRAGGSLTRGQGYTLTMDATTTCDTGDGTANANRYLASVPTVGGQEVTVRRNQ